MLLRSEHESTGFEPSLMDENLVITVGTAFHDLVPTLIQHPRRLVIVVDVPYELDKLLIPEEARHRVVLLAVGNHMTVQQLVEDHGNHAQQEALKNLPSMSASDGLAQLPIGGVVAVNELMARTNVQQWLQDVVPQLIQHADGHLPQVRIGIRAGTAGGTASQGAIVFLNAVLRILQDSGVISVDVAIHLVGGISFTGRRFSRTQQNTACSLVSWLQQIRTKSEISVTYQIFAFEALPVGSNRSLRARLIADEQSAIYSPSVQDHIRQVRSNHAADGEYGNVVLVQTRNYKPISQEQIRNDLANEYLPAIESLLRICPAYSQVRRLRFEYADSRKHIEPVDELIHQILEIAEDGGVEDALLDLIDPGLSFETVELHVDMLNSTVLPLERLTEHFSRSPATPSDFQQQLALVMAIQERIADELTLTEELSAELQLSLDASIESFFQALQKALSQPLFSWNRSQRRMDDLCETMEHYRECLNALRDVEAERELLNAAYQQTSQLIEQDLERVSFLIRQLKQHLSFTENVSRLAMVSARPLEKTFRGLFAASLSRGDRSDLLGDTLQQCVAYVNREGLKDVVAANDTSVDSIIASVHHAENATDGPAWGGLPGPADSIDFIVYPFVPAADQTLLKTLHQEADTGVHVAFSCPTSASLNVVQLKLTFCRQLSDLLTPYYQSGLRRALDDPASALFLEDPNILSDIGIEIR